MDNFKEKLLGDRELLKELAILGNRLDDDDLINDIYEVCREVFLINYEAKQFRDNGRLVAFYPEEKFETLGKKIDSFITTVSFDKSAVLEEILIVLKRYYIETATEYEKNDRTIRLNDNRDGTVSTIYFLNQIDWNVFSKAIRQNVVLV